MKKLIVVSLFLVLGFSTNSLAQLGTAGISGTVTDSSGAVIPLAKVTTKNKATGQTREATTSGEGLYKITNLSPAVYEVRVEAPGFAVAVIEGVAVEVGEVPTVNVSLKPAATAQTVEVTEEGVLGVDTVTSHVAGVVSDRTLATLPLNGRNFLDLAFLIPGNRPAPNYDPTKTNTIEVSSAGQLGRGGNIAVDGADNNDDVVGGTLENFPQDGIQEFQIITNRFSADIGRSASSAVNIVTKGGSNEIHGAGAIFFRDDALSALPATLDRNIVKTLGRPSFDREQYAGSVGGPVKRDHAWWFSAFEYRKQDAVVLTGVRDFTQKQVLNSFSSAPLRDTLWTSRVDWQVRKSDDMFFRYSLQRENDVDRASLREPIGTAEQRQQSFNNYQAFVYNWVHTFSPRVVNDFVFHENNFINSIPTFVSNTNELRFPSIQDGGNFRISQRTRQNRLQFRDGINWTHGQHLVKFGGEFQRLDTDAIFDLFGSGTIFLTENFASRDRNGDGKIDDNDIPIALTIRSAAPKRPPTVPNVDNNFFAWFVQDDWKVRSNFTLNVGLRYELDTNVKNLDNFSEENPIVLPFLSPGGRHRDKKNFAPRFGFNWDPLRDGRTSVHGGYGIYYDRIVLEVALLERLLDGRALPLEVRDGSALDAAGNFKPSTPTLKNPFVGTLIPGAGAVGINIIDNNLGTPYVQQFNFGIQREIIRNWVLSIDGIHSFGSKFIIGRPIAAVFNPVVGGTDSIVNIESSVKTWYDAMLVNVEKRFANRFGFNTSYTWSKSFNFSNDDQIPFQAGPLNPNNLRLEKGPPPNDERHRFTFAGAYDAPFGIQISPILTAASSVPMDILLPDGSTRIPQIQRNAGARQFHTGAELNAFLRQINSAGGIPGFGLLPLVRDNLSLGKNFFSMDFRVTKTFKISERLKAQAIGEVFNLFNVTNVRGFNNVNYSGFQNVLNSVTFGAPVQTAGGVFGTGGPRAFQLAGRIQF